MTEINIEAYEKTLDLIKENPDEWVQESYRCGSGMCFAGWAAIGVGGARWTERSTSLEDVTVPGKRRKAHVSDYAEEVLGGDCIEDLTDEESEEIYGLLNLRHSYFGIFNASNTLANLEGALRVLKARAAK